MLKIERPKPYKRIGLGAAALVVGFIGSYSLFSSMEPAEDTGEVLSSQTEQREDAAQDSRDKTESQAKQQTQTDGSATTTDSAATTSWSPQPAAPSPQTSSYPTTTGSTAPSQPTPTSSPQRTQPSSSTSDGGSTSNDTNDCSCVDIEGTLNDTVQGIRLPSL